MFETKTARHQATVERMLGELLSLVTSNHKLEISKMSDTQTTLNDLATRIDADKTKVEALEKAVADKDAALAAKDATIADLTAKPASAAAPIDTTAIVNSVAALDATLNPAGA